MSFEVGQLVMAVRSKPSARAISREEAKQKGYELARVGAIYTIRAVGEIRGTLWCRLVEIVNPPDQFGSEPYFAQEYFRPLDDSKLAIFRQIVAPKPKELVR
jgi:hypothetical protein